MIKLFARSVRLLALIGGSSMALVACASMADARPLPRDNAGRNDNGRHEGGRFELAPQDGQGYVFRDHVFDGLRRREAP